MLNRRLLSAAVIIGTMLAIVWLDYHLDRWSTWFAPGSAFAAISFLLISLASMELASIWNRAGRPTNVAVVLVGTWIMMLGAFLPIYWPKPLGECPIGLFGGTFLGILGAVTLAGVFEIALFRGSTGAFERMARHVFVYVYLALLAGAIPPHRRLFEDNGFGLCAAIALVTTVKMSDAAAYGFGKWLGRTKLAPHISAGKTMEGAVGSLLGGFLGAVIIFRWVAPFVQGIERTQSWTWIVVYSVVITLAGILGDLVESIIKRDAGCKDSGGLLPGLGGVLDVIDSLIFSAPISCLFWILLDNL